MNLEGQDCVCNSSCQACQVTSPNCLNCTLDSSGATTQCFSCLPGFELSLDNISCSACPTGCSLCSGSSFCTACQNTFILIGNVCVCDASLQMYNSGSQCQLCSDIFYGCDVCTYNGVATSCTSCVSGMYLNGSVCSYCNYACESCSSELTCTSCPQGLVLSNGSCICDAACSACSGNVSDCS